MKRRVLVLALLLIVAPIVTAHGGRDMQNKQSESYNVEWFTYNYVVRGEFVRFGYNVTDLSSGDKVDLSGTTVEFVFQDDSGSTVESKDVTLQSHDSAYDIGDIEIPAGGTTSFENHVPLPQGESLTFTLGVRSPDSGNGGGNGDGNGDGGGNPMPLPGWVAAVALAGAALVWTRRR